MLVLSRSRHPRSVPESELEEECDQNDLADVLDNKCKNTNSNNNTGRSNSVNVNSENIEDTENENSDENAENKSSNMGSENKTAEISNNVQDENRNNHPKRVKNSIARLAQHTPHARSEEAEGNENAEHCNEAMGRTISYGVCHCNDKHERIGKNKIRLAQTRGSKKGLRALDDKGKKVARQEMNQTRK